MGPRLLGIAQLRRHLDHVRASWRYLCPKPPETFESKLCLLSCARGEFWCFGNHYDTGITRDFVYSKAKRANSRRCYSVVQFVATYTDVSSNPYYCSFDLAAFLTKSTHLRSGYQCRIDGYTLDLIADATHVNRKLETWNHMTIVTRMNGCPILTTVVKWFQIFLNSHVPRKLEIWNHMTTLTRMKVCPILATVPHVIPDFPQLKMPTQLHAHSSRALCAGIFAVWLLAMDMLCYTHWRSKAPNSKTGQNHSNITHIFEQSTCYNQIFIFPDLTQVDFIFDLLFLWYFFRLRKRFCRKIDLGSLFQISSSRVSPIRPWNVENSTC